VVLLALLPSARQDHYGLVSALSLAAALGVTLLFATPVIAAVMVRHRPSHDGIDVVLLVASAWLGAVAVLAVAASWVARTGAVALPLASGGWTTFAQWAALVAGSAMAGWLLARDSARARWWQRLTADEGSLGLRREGGDPDERAPPPLLRLAPGSAQIVAAGDEAGGPALATVTHEPEHVRKLLFRRRAWAVALLVVQLGVAALLAADWSFHRQPLGDVVELAAGFGHVCARTADGSVWCWGAGAVPARGGALLESQLRARRVTGMDQVTSLVSGDDQLCALRADRSVWCWDTLARSSAAPRKVEGLPAATRLAAGGSRCCALDGEGAVWCWGRSGMFDPPADELVATRMTTPAGVRALAVDDHSLCVAGDEELVCSWQGCEARAIPLASVQLSARPELALAEGQLCALGDDGALRCGWLRGDCESLWLAPLAERGQVASLAAGSFAICSQDLGGTVVCRDPHGVVLRYARPEGRALVAGGDHYCVLVDGGQVTCWGTNLHGQLGDGTRRDRADPELVRY
jgi:hypothetical protein